MNIIDILLYVQFLCIPCIEFKVIIWCACALQHGDLADCKHRWKFYRASPTKSQVHQFR